jgi:hypothetical protein
LEADPRSGVERQAAIPQVTEDGLAHSIVSDDVSGVPKQPGGCFGS